MNACTRMKFFANIEGTLKALQIEAFESILRKYPQFRENIMLIARNHSDRLCAEFGRKAAFSREPKVLWRRAVQRIKLLRRWSSRHIYETKWLQQFARRSSPTNTFRLKALSDSISTKELSRPQLLAALSMLTECQNKLVKLLAGPEARTK